MTKPYWTTLPKSAFDIKKLMDKFESILDAKTECEKRIKLLEKGDKESRKAAKRLKGCKKSIPCASPACPKCTRKLRRWYTGQILENIICFEQRDDFNLDSLCCITIVPIDSALPLDGLLNRECPPKLLMKRHEDRLRNQLIRAELHDIVVFGAIEIDFDVETQQWEPHFHLITYNLNRNSPQWYRFMRNNGYCQSLLGDTPVQIDPLNDKPEQVSYILKSYFSRKEKWRDKSSNKKRGRKYRLRPTQERISLVFLNQLDFEDRIFLYKARRFGNKILETSVSEKLNKNS